MTNGTSDTERAHEIKSDWRKLSDDFGVVCKVTVSKIAFAVMHFGQHRADELGVLHADALLQHFLDLFRQL